MDFPYSMIFDFNNVFLIHLSPLKHETAFPLRSLEVNINHNQMPWSLKMKDTVSSICPAMKRNCKPGTGTFKKTRIVKLQTNMSSPPTPFSEGGSNQSHPEHKKRELSSQLYPFRHVSLTEDKYRLTKFRWMFDSMELMK